jgi:hypothetical protein
VTNRSRRLVIILSAVVLVLSLLAGLAAATTGFFGLAYDKAVEQVEDRKSEVQLPVPPEDPEPGEEQSLRSAAGRSDHPKPTVPTPSIRTLAR